MPGCHRSLPRPALTSLLALLLLAAACLPNSEPTPPATIPPEASSQPLPLVEPDILQIPESFRYEMTLRPAGAAAEPATLITGQYWGGALAQTTRQGETATEELIVAPDPADGLLHSYTRAPEEATWTRWPGMGFDAVFGLASPFSALRLYPLADERTPGEPEPLPETSEPTVKVQTVSSAATIDRLLKAGASAVAINAEQRSALEFQLAPLRVPQTVTFWVSEAGRVYQAAATLLTAGADGQPTPWLEVTWRYWGYDDPTIAVIPPADFTDVTELAAAAPADAAAPHPEIPLDPTTTLRVRAFANPGTPVEEATITIYPAKKNQALATIAATDAQFVLPDGLYDVQVQSENAEVWLRDVAVTAGAVVSHDVLFDFGTLALTVTQAGATPQVDIVIYPAGQRQTWIDWRTENPATVRLPAGLYDVEVALPDFSATRRIEGVQVLGGETVAVTVDLGE